MNTMNETSANIIVEQEPVTRLFDNKHAFREKYRKYFDYLEATELTKDPYLYNFDDYELQFRLLQPIPESQLQNTMKFRALMNKAFREFHCGQIGTENQILLETEQLIEDLYNRYVNKIENLYRPDLLQQDTFIIRWADYTKLLIWESFSENYLSCDSFGIYKSNRDLLKRALWAVDCKKEELTIPGKTVNNTNPRLDLVLYNLWGQAFYRKKYETDSKRDASTEEGELVTVDYDVNREYFTLFFCESFLSKLLSPSMSELDCLENEIQAMTWLQDLFVDFMHRVCECYQYQEAALANIAQYWQMVTTDVLNRLLLIDQVGLVSRSNTSDGLEDIRDVLVPQSTVIVFNNRRRLIEKCINKINGCLTSFINAIKSNCLEKPWATALQKLNIDYTQLYNDLRKLSHIGPEVTFNVFKYAFQNADFSTIIESAEWMVELYGKNHGSRGCIQRLIKGLGLQLPKDWYYSAAHSAMKMRNVQASVDGMGKLKVTVPSEKLEPYLKRSIPGFKFSKNEGERTSSKTG